MNRLTVVVIAVAVAAGCASAGPKQEKPGSPLKGLSYVEVEKQAPLAAGQGRIYLFRTQAAMLWRQDEPALVDGAPVGMTHDKSFFFVDLPPGMHKVSSPTDPDGITFPLEAGEVKFVKGWWITTVNFKLMNRRDAEEEDLPLLSYRDPR